VRDKIQMKGILNIKKLIDGKYKTIYKKENLIVSVGLAYLVLRLDSNSSSLMRYVAVGTGTSTAAVTDTQLQTELDRKIFDDTDTLDNVWHTETIFTGTEAVGTWKEAGIFNASSGGTMLNRVNIDFTKGSGDNVKVEWDITFTGA